MHLLLATYAVILEQLLFCYNDPATREIYTLSLHDALPISEVFVRIHRSAIVNVRHIRQIETAAPGDYVLTLDNGFCIQSSRDRKSTRLNSSHSQISYAVFCLKKKKQTQPHHTTQPCDKTPY